MPAPKTAREKTPPPEKTPTAPLPQLAAIADELGALEKEYALATAPFGMKLPRMKALREALQLACPAKAEDGWTVEGLRFGVTLGPCAWKRTVNVAKLLKLIGARMFVSFASCSLTDLEKHVGEETRAQAISKDRTGARSLRTYEKGQA